MNAARFHTGFGCPVPQTLWVGISKEHLSGLFSLISCPKHYQLFGIESGSPTILGDNCALAWLKVSTS